LAGPVTGLWPWLVLAGLGAFHGINPAMGWLFAVALGLHRHSRAVVLGALAPIAFGHMLSIVAVVAAVLLLGLVVDQTLLRRAAGAAVVVACGVGRRRAALDQRLLGRRAGGLRRGRDQGGECRLQPPMGMGVLPSGSRTDIREVLGGMPGVRLTEICSSSTPGKGPPRSGHAGRGEAAGTAWRGSEDA
jgi:hypothetical protein